MVVTTAYQLGATGRILVHENNTKTGNNPSAYVILFPGYESKASLLLSITANADIAAATLAIPAATIANMGIIHDCYGLLAAGGATPDATDID